MSHLGILKLEPLQWFGYIGLHPFEMGLHEVSSDPAALVMLRHGMEESREHSPRAS